MPSNNKEYAKNYYQTKRTQILETMSQKVRCEICDLELTKGYIAKHNQTAPHILRVKLFDLENPVQQQPQ